MRCPRCGRELLRLITKPFYRCESCKIKYAVADFVKDAAGRMVEKHKRTLDKLGVASAALDATGRDPQGETP